MTYLFDQLFRFVAEMPLSGRVDDTWCRAMATWYDRSSGRYDPDLIYRSWPIMLKLAEYNVPDRFVEQDLIEPTRQAQADAREFVLAGGVSRFSDLDGLRNAIDQVPNIAKQNILRFLTEFPAMLGGLYGQEVQEECETFESGFIEITDKIQKIRNLKTGKLADVRFVPIKGRKVGPLVCIGDDGRKRPIKIERPFLLSKYPCTRQLHWYFISGNPNEKSKHHIWQLYKTIHYRSNELGEPPIDPPDRIYIPHNPVTDLRWVEAWAIALFYHSRLASEDEWEYACRARPGKNRKPWKWCYGNKSKYLKHFIHIEESKYGLDWEDDLGEFLDVDECRPWAGLFSMNGGAAEWTSTWYHKDRTKSRDPQYVGFERVSRGGGVSVDCFLHHKDTTCGTRRHNREYKSHLPTVRFARYLPDYTGPVEEQHYLF